MNKKQAQAEERRKIREDKRKAALLAKELQESLEELEVDYSQPEPQELKKQRSEVPWEDEPETVEKMDGEAAAAMSMPPRPTSWAELDAAEHAAEQAQELRELSWSVQELVYNIISTDLSPADKAGAIKDVGDGFQTRVEMLLSDPMMDEKEIDLEVLALEAIQAHDSRQMSFLENWVDKAVLTAKRENKLSDEQFALVYEENGNKVRKYPIMDKAHVRNALARAAQQIQAGGKGAEDAKRALPKIRAAAKKMGIEVSTKKERNSIMVEKDASGQWRWVGWVSNNFVDTDGDIFSEAAHQEYVEWLSKNMDAAPLFLTWHTPDTQRKSEVDFATYEHGFLLMSGPLTEGEAESLLKARKDTEIGMSHGTLVLRRDKDDPRVILKYRTFEVSDLPLERAANPFTALETIAKEVDMDKKDYLAALLGKEKADKLLAQTGVAQKALLDAGIEHKEAKEPEKPETSAPEPVPAELIEKIKSELHIDDLNAWVTKANEALEKVEVLEALVKELSKSTDEKVAEKIAPPLASFAWLQKNRDSASEDTKVPEESELARSAPKVGWLSEATGTAPIKE